MHIAFLNRLKSLSGFQVTGDKIVIWVVVVAAVLAVVIVAAMAEIGLVAVVDLTETLAGKMQV